MSGLKTNLVLVAVAITSGLILYTTYLQEQHVAPEQLLLPELLDSSPGKIEISADGGERRVALFRDNNSWKMHTYDGFSVLAADKIRVQNLLYTLATLAVQHVVSADGDNSLYIQDPAKYVIQIDRQKIFIGKNNSVDYRRYIRHDGNIYLTKDELAPILGTQRLFFASHNLLPDGFYPIAATLNGQLMDFSASGEAGAIAQLAWQEGRALLVKYEDNKLFDAADILYVHGDDGRQILFVVAATEPVPVLVRPDSYLSYQLPRQLWQELIPAAASK
ncbi:MAG: hypothetical protein ACNYPG_03810 [Candidatus Porifericomitaceae bacterium WSBS_2022_MAG_OTU9]